MGAPLVDVAFNFLQDESLEWRQLLLELGWFNQELKACWPAAAQVQLSWGVGLEPVSYTHLTLPTT